MAVINLDRNASYGLLPEVKEKLSSLFGELLNPSSIHIGGQKSRALLDNARESIARLLSLKTSDQVIFNSGATEANNTAVFSNFSNCSPSNLAGISAVTSAYEHPSIIEPIRKLETIGHKVAFVKRAQSSGLSANDFTPFLSHETQLVSLMLANNETGEIFPVKEIFSKARELAPIALLHSDAVQALGKMTLSFAETGADALSISGHKIGALSGIGALIVKADVALNPLLLGGSQELRHRAGTENLLGAVSFGLAAEHLSKTLEERINKLKINAQIIRQVLKDKLPQLAFISDSFSTIPNTISARIPGVRGDDLVVGADLEGVLISSGAACSSGKQLPSHVILALGYSEIEASEVIRVSVGAENTQQELELAANKIANVAIRLSKKDEQ